MGCVDIMIKFEEKFLDIMNFPERQPDFNNILNVLDKKVPKENTLFEFSLNPLLEAKLAGYDFVPESEEDIHACKIKAYANAGYDYTTVRASDFLFKHANNNHGLATVSLNESGVIFDRESFEAYKWENPDDYYNGRIERIEKYLPEGMKFIVCGPGGVLENVMTLTGYDNLCYMLADDPELVEEIFEQVGTRILEYYSAIIDCDSVGAIISNDDWGFNTHTLLSPSDMKKYVFPQHKKITELSHKHGKPVILHSCGQLEKVYDDIINHMKYDGKHSYEDKIMPVEAAYEQLQGKIAVLGGLDMNFICKSTPQEIYDRSCNMLEKAKSGGYALGTGNSVPKYVPFENYFAMIAAVNYNR